MPQFIITWIVTAISMIVASYLIPGIVINSITAAVIGAVVFGLINAIVKPLLVLLTLPLTILTLGLFLLVINAICFSLVGYFTPDFQVNGFLNALFGSFIVSFVGGLLNQLFNNKQD
jgi:putative membrane protein